MTVEVSNPFQCIIDEHLSILQKESHHFPVMEDPEAKHPDTGVGRVAAVRRLRLIVQIEHKLVTDLHQVAMTLMILGYFAAIENSGDREHLPGKGEPDRELSLPVIDNLNFLLDIIEFLAIDRAKHFGPFHSLCRMVVFLHDSIAEWKNEEVCRGGDT
ncbi:MAG: hypothetical protein ACK5PS_12305 [Desulfopila sp.]